MQGGFGKVLPFFKPTDYVWRPEVHEVVSSVELFLSIHTRVEVVHAPRMSQDERDWRDIETIIAILSADAAMQEVRAVDRRDRKLIELIDSRIRTLQ